MNKNTVILIAVGGVGVYLAYKYADEHGYLLKWFPSLFGPATPAPVEATQPLQVAGPAGGGAASPAGVKLIDTTGLVVTDDINDSLAGTVLIKGAPTRLAIIQTDGRIFDSTGQEVTAALSAMGIDVDALRAAFAGAPRLQKLQGLAAANYQRGLAWLT